MPGVPSCSVIWLALSRPRYDGWPPLSAPAWAFYSPCTDGDMDMGIVGHEYTHAISNRMIGGPDEGITS